MKLIKYTIFLFLIVVFSHCDDDGFTNNNPYLPNYSFSKTIDLNLPSFILLNQPANGVLITDVGVGVRGVIVFNTGSGFTAFDAACPNQPLSDCSTMSISSINAVCACDGASYSLFTGLAPGKEYPLKPYRIEINGSTLRVYN